MEQLQNSTLSTNTCIGKIYQYIQSERQMLNTVSADACEEWQLLRVLRVYVRLCMEDVEYSGVCIWNMYSWRMSMISCSVLHHLN